MTVVGWVLASLVAFLVLPVLVAMLFRRDLAESGDRGPGDAGEWPEVTVVVPAKDEGEGVREAFRSLTALTYPRLRIVAIDDRSEDDTGAILDELASADDRVRVIHVEELPDGWLGKNHANHLGASSTGSPWLLFTDGDIHFTPDTVERAIQHCERNRVDHLTLFPTMTSGDFREDLALCGFAFLFGIRFGLWLVRTRLKFFYAGVGAFNLVRREVYEDIGGHRRLALEVLDDVKLGKLVKAHGHRQDALDGSEQLRVRWQDGLGGIARGLEKNAFAAFGYSVPWVIVSTLVVLGLFVFPYVGLVTLATLAIVATGGGEAAWGFGTTVVLLQLTFAAVVWRADRNLIISLGLIPAFFIFIYILWRSTWRTLRRGGVEWRGTFYPLAVLRAGQV